MSQDPFSQNPRWDAVAETRQRTQLINQATAIITREPQALLDLFKELIETGDLDLSDIQDLLAKLRDLEGVIDSE